MWACKNCGTPLVHDPPPLPDHPFPNLFHNNDPPSAVDVPVIRHDIREVETHLSVVDEEIARLQDVLAQLTRKQDALRERLDGNRSFVSPLRRFPNELLSHIFIDCLPVDIPDIRAVVLKLGSVCHTWWAVALSTPQLWTSVYPTGRRSWFRAAQVWLLRSGNLPLSLLYHPPAAYSPAKIAYILELYSTRWEHLNFSISEIHEEFDNAIDEGFPSLRSLVLNLGLDFGPWWDLTTSTQLRKFSYTNSVLDKMIDVPWGQLTHLTLWHQSQHRCVDFLSQAPNLVECNLHEVRTSPAEDSIAPSVLLPHLQCLLVTYEIHDSDTLDMLLFERATAPVLRELRLTSNTLAADRASSFMTFLHRSRCSLDLLAIHYIDIPEDEFIQCLSELPSLRELHIAGRFTFSDRVVSSLERSEDTPNNGRLPALTVLTLINTVINIEGLAKMIRSRWRTPSRDESLPRAHLPTEPAPVPLTYVEWRVTEPDFYPKPDLEPLRALKRDGFNVDLPEPAPHEHSDFDSEDDTG
ncbi:hypothetical protein PLICRDRAFT_54608 [Plicaturopsis crispa FD-325 SS-3]|nr:hypothetical protein PLICRDRAFT_54608 [Plicaturopsis crispa FD-325 SS-3]